MVTLRYCVMKNHYPCGNVVKTMIEAEALSDAIIEACEPGDVVAVYEYLRRDNQPSYMKVVRLNRIVKHG